MAVLADRDIRNYLADGTLTITPLDPSQIQPASVDLCLGPLLLIPDPHEDGGYRQHDLRERSYRLYQHDFVLGATLETIGLPNTLTAVLAGKSSRAREGIQVECAGWVDPGWYGELTFEITRFRRGHVDLHLGMAIAQIVFQATLSPADRPYGHPDLKSKYQNSRGPVPSRAGGGA